MSYTRTQDDWGNQDSFQEFCEYYGLSLAYTPLPRRKYPTWDMLAQLQGTLNGLRETRQSIPCGNLLPSREGGSGPIMRRHLHALGSYRIDSGTRARWANPNWVHGDEHQDPVHDLATHIEYAQRVPTLTLADVGSRFGMSASDVRNWLKDHDEHVQAPQRAAKQRIGRSIKTAVAWTDTPLITFLERYPAPIPTVRRWVREFAPADDWTVPEQPEIKHFQTRR